MHKVLVFFGLMIICLFSVISYCVADVVYSEKVQEKVVVIEKVYNPYSNEVLIIKRKVISK